MAALPPHLWPVSYNTINRNGSQIFCFVSGNIVHRFEVVKGHLLCVKCFQTDDNSASSKKYFINGGSFAGQDPTTGHCCTPRSIAEDNKKRLTDEFNDYLWKTSKNYALPADLNQDYLIVARELNLNLNPNERSQERVHKNYIDRSPSTMARETRAAKGKPEPQRKLGPLPPLFRRFALENQAQVQPAPAAASSSSTHSLWSM